MNQLPHTSFAARFNAFLAAAAVTATLLSGIDSLAAMETATPLMAQTASTQPV